MIPKCIHKVCIVDGFELPELPKGIDEAIRTWKEYNPDYELKVYSGNDCITRVDGIPICARCVNTVYMIWI